MHHKFHILSLVTLAVALQEAASHAGQRSSIAYVVPAENIGTGGKRVTSTSYNAIGNVGEVIGVSTGASTSPTAKHGYIAQLADVIGLQLTAAPTTINETANRQLAGAQVLDDLTTLTVPSSSITWSIQSGPISSISTGGLAIAATVYQNTAASVQGSYLGFSGNLGLTVLDTLPDNYGSYAGDGMGDDWQVQFFGFNHLDAVPSGDPDRDGLTNMMEYAVGQSPILPGIIPMQTVKNGGTLEFTYPRAVSSFSRGVSFIVEWSDTLALNDWQTTGVNQQIISDNGTLQQVKATLSSGALGRRFVRLRVTASP